MVMLTGQTAQEAVAVLVIPIIDFRQLGLIVPSYVLAMERQCGERRTGFPVFQTVSCTPTSWCVKTLQNVQLIGNWAVPHAAIAVRGISGQRASNMHPSE